MVLAHIMQELLCNGIVRAELTPHFFATFSRRYYKIVNTKTQVIYDIALDRDDNLQQYAETDEYIENETSIDFIDQMIFLGKNAKTQ